MSKISIKKDYTDGQVLYGSELNANNQVIESGVNDNFTKIQTLDSAKANASDVNTSLASKVSTTTYATDKNNTQAAIDAKASVTYVNTQLEGKANTSALDSKLDKTSAGSLSLLNTTDKSSLVAAINEVNRETLPIATTSSLGGIKPDGNTITVDVDGTAHAVGGGGEGGTSDYTALSNRPSINNVVLVAGLDAEDLNLAKASDVETSLLAKANTVDVYTKTEANSAITNATENLTTKTYVDGGLELKANADDVYTKTETDSAITSANSGKANTTDVTTALATKQDKLTAGENITILNNTISSTGGATIDQSNVSPLDPATGDLWIDTGDTNYLAQVDDVISTESTNAIQNKVITSYIKGAVLYDNATGSNAALTLSDSIINYKKAYIEFKTSNNAYKSIIIDNPNNKKINLLSEGENLASSIVLINCNIQISGNSLTWLKQNFIVFGATYGAPGTDMSYYNIKITKVVGFEKEV